MMENLLLLSLKDAQKRGVVVSLHTDRYHSAACSVGYVEQLSDSEVQLRAISPNGMPAGYELRPLEELYRVDVDGLYERKIHFLACHHDKIFRDIPLEHASEETSICFSTLQDAQHARKIVELWTDKEDSVVGYVKELQAEAVKILSIDEFGREDGTVVMDLEAIVSMDYNSLQCQELEYLHEHWNE